MAGLFSKPKMPEPEPVTPMPDPQSPETEAAKRAEINKARARSGRASTILSGGGDFSKEKLG